MTAIRTGVLLALVVALAPVNVSAQTPTAPATAEGSGAERAFGEPVDPHVELQVAVRQRVQDGEPIPVGNATVTLHVVEQPHELVERMTSRVDADGRAVFVVPVRAGAEAVAEVDQGGRFFSEAVPLDEPGRHRMNVDLVPETHDPSVVFAASMQTIIEPWENYVTVTQIWTLGADGGATFRGDPQDASSFVQIPLPSAAEGIRLAQGEDDANVLNDVIFYAGEVTPVGTDGRQRPHVIVQFSLKTNGARRVAYAQPLGLDVSRLSVVVPQTTVFDRHPRIDVDIVPPSCDDPAVACIDDVGSDATGVQLREDVEVRVGRGRGTAGQTLSFDTVGWPGGMAWERWAGAIVGFLSLLFGLMLILRERDNTHERAADEAAAALVAERAALLAAAVELDDQLRNAEVMERDYRLAQERIAAQLAVLERRARELRNEA